VNYGWQQQEVKLRHESKGRLGTEAQHRIQQGQKRNTDTKDKRNTDNKDNKGTLTKRKKNNCCRMQQPKYCRTHDSRDARQLNMKLRPEGTTGLLGKREKSQEAKTNPRKKDIKETETNKLTRRTEPETRAYQAQATQLNNRHCYNV
jgi:hypothetical protein